MKILIAGASGAIGQPLINFLIQDGHEVYGISQSKERALNIKDKGATPIILNVLDREAVFSTMAAIKPYVVIDMLTSLPKEYTPEEMRKAAERDAKIRIEGGAHLLAAAEIHGTKRYVAQSTGFWYAPGQGLADESESLAFKATPGIASGSRLYEEIEKRLFQSTKLQGTALRFGFFYGPGTWFHPGGSVAQQIIRRQYPMIGKGQGIWNFVHIEDAAKAIVSAIQNASGIYNIVNDQPSQMHDWLPAFAHYLDAPQPPNLSEKEAESQMGKDVVYYATKLRGASNAKAKQVLHFKPRPFEWLQVLSY